MEQPKWKNTPDDDLVKAAEMLRPLVCDIMHKSNYSYDIVDEVLCIYDENLGGMSVTNNIEQVIKSILIRMKHFQNRTIPKIIIYCDSSGNWDGINFEVSRYNEGFKSFYPIGATDRDEAIALAKRITQLISKEDGE